MLKIVTQRYLTLPRLTVLLAMVYAIVSPLLTPIAAGAESAIDSLDSPDALGVCPLHNLSGYTSITLDGELINLKAYCHQLTEKPPEPISTDRFWQSFTQVADTETIAFAETLDQESVLAYGDTICPFLQQDGTLQELRQMQADQALPTGFEVAVTVAAINAYCPEYRSEIGR